MLKELDDIGLRRTYIRNRLKRFVKREGHWYSLKDKVNESPKLKEVVFKTDIELKKEAIKEYHERNTT